MTKTTNQKDFAEALPNWVPTGAHRYLMHTETGKSIREIARMEGLHASTVLRQIRRIETRRDDPLFDAALKSLGANLARFVQPSSTAKESTEMSSHTRSPAAPSEAHLKAEARRILRRLCETGAVLAVAQDMEKAVVVRDGQNGTSTRTAVVDTEIAQAMALKEWINSNSQGKITRYRITQAGRTALTHLLSGETLRDVSAKGGAGAIDPDAMLDPDADDPRARLTRYNLAESPLAALARRRDKDGKPFLSDDLVRAGERLREDFELAQMGPSVTQNWEHFLTSGCASGQNHAGGGSGSASGARKRVQDALSDLGAGLSDVVLRCCCFLEGLEKAEKKMGWSARSGKVVLRIALIRLKRHYDELGQSGQMIG